MSAPRSPSAGDTLCGTSHEAFTRFRRVGFEAIYLAAEPLRARRREAEVPARSTVNDFLSIHGHAAFLSHSLKRGVKGWDLQLDTSVRNFFGLA